MTLVQGTPGGTEGSTRYSCRNILLGLATCTCETNMLLLARSKVDRMAQHKWIFPSTKVILLLWSTLLGATKASGPFTSADTYLAPILGKF